MNKAEAISLTSALVLGCVCFNLGLPSRTSATAMQVWSGVSDPNVTTRITGLLDFTLLQDKERPDVEIAHPFDVRAFGAKGDGLNDDTLAVQNAIDAAYRNRGSQVFFPSGTFLISQITLRQGISLIGSGINPAPHGLGSTLQQKPGTDLDLIVSDQPHKGCQHWGIVSNFRLLGAKGTRNSSGIKFAATTCEGMTFQHLLIEDFAVDGIQVAGGVPFLAEDLHLFGNGVGSGQGYGVNIATKGDDPSQMYQFLMISGDNNQTALIRVSRGSIGGHQSFLIEGVKAEKHFPGRQNDVVVVDNMNGAPVVVLGVGAVNNSGEIADSIIKVTGSNARLTWFGINGDSGNPNGYMYYVNDTYNHRTFTGSSGTGGAFAGSYFFDVLGTTNRGSHVRQRDANGDLAGALRISDDVSASQNFASPFNATPVCTASPTSNPENIRWWVTATHTEVTVHLSSRATIAFNYHCIGNPD